VLSVDGTVKYDGSLSEFQVSRAVQIIQCRETSFLLYWYHAVLVA